MILWRWQEFLPMSRWLRDRNPFTTRPLLQATVSFSSSLEFHRDNNPRRREEVDDRSEGGWQGKTKSRQSMLSRGAAVEGWEGVVVGWDRANCFNKAAAERRTVVESGNWLGSSCAGGTAREGNIQIPSLLAQRIANAGRNRVEYYYSTILAVPTDRCDVSRGRSNNGRQLGGDKCILPSFFLSLLLDCRLPSDIIHSLYDTFNYYGCNYIKLYTFC